MPLNALKRLIRSIRPLSYQTTINECPLCGWPTSGVLCTPCATK
jgi:hypothetical protein